MDAGKGVSTHILAKNTAAGSDYSHVLFAKRTRAVVARNLDGKNISAPFTAARASWKDEAAAPHQVLEHHFS